MSSGNVLTNLMYSPEVLHSSVGFTANLSDAAGSDQSVTVAGAALGDFVLVSAAADLAGLIVTGYVSAADTLKIRIQNETGAKISTNHTIYICVLPRKR